MATPINRYQIPSPAETANVLAEAMDFTKPPAKARVMAGPHPVNEGEGNEVARLYAMIRKIEVRQALLDVLVAATIAEV